MKKLKLLLSGICLTIFSCQFESVEDLVSKDSIEQKMISNRLNFNSEEDFVDFYKKYADASDEEISKLMMPLYEKGFYSLRPVVTEQNENFIYNHYKKAMKGDIEYTRIGEPVVSEEVVIIPNDYIDNLDDLEDIVGDDTFAAFLNSEAEIVVDDELYKYTDVGLFITDVQKEDILEDYLISKNISTDITIETPVKVKEALISEFPEEGVTKINNDLSYFKIMPLEDDVSGYGDGAYTPAQNSPVSTDPSYNTFVSNLSNCDTDPGLFGDWFGDNYKCIDKYENRRRVKTKAFNYNYKLVFHLGVKCVHQYRGWTGFWRVEATDEIRLAVEAAQFQYDSDALLGNNAITETMAKAHFFQNDKWYVFNSPNFQYTTSNFYFPNLNYSHTNYYNTASLPGIFNNSGLGLTFVCYKTGWDELDNAIQKGINSNLNAQKLNNFFYTKLYGYIKDVMVTTTSNYSYTPPANRTGVFKFPQTGKLLIQKSHYETGYNIGKRGKTFDWGAEIKLSTNNSGNGANWGDIAVSPGNIFTRPTDFRVKIIGAARRGSGWHGNKFSIGID